MNTKQPDAPEAPQTKTVGDLIRDLIVNAKGIAEESVQLDDACKECYAGWRPDGKGKSAGELQDADVVRRRILANIKEKEALVEAIFTKLSQAEDEIDAAFQIVNAVRLITK